MSSQFSYELDERQIRILMQDAELDLDSAAWERFEQTAQPEINSSGNAFAFASKINFAISRSVIVPVIFVALIGGLSAMLFSFVDFKKKDSIKETALLPAINKASATTSTTEMPVEKEKQLTITTQAKETPAVQIHTVATRSVIEPKKEEKSMAVIPTSPNVIEKTVENLARNVPEKKMPASPLKRKRKKLTTEEMPTIQTSSTINLNAGNEEPELELK